MNSTEKAFCVLCLFLGYVLPWGLLIGGAAVSWLSSGDFWQTVSATMICISLIVFLVMAFLKHLYNNRPRPC